MPTWTASAVPSCLGVTFNQTGHNKLVADIFDTVFGPVNALTSESLLMAINIPFLMAKCLSKGLFGVHCQNVSSKPDFVRLLVNYHRQCPSAFGIVTSVDYLVDFVNELFVSCIREDRMNIAQRKSGDSSIDHKSLVHPPIGIITDALTFKVARLAALNEKAGSQHFKSKHGITLNQWRILGLAFALGPVSSREVREILYMDKGQFSRVVKELLGLGFIQAHANAEDGRAIELSVTERGRIIHDKLINFSAERNEAVVSVLTAEDCRKLIRLLDKVNAHTQALQKQ